MYLAVSRCLRNHSFSPILTFMGVNIFHPLLLLTLNPLNRSYHHSPVSFAYSLLFFLFLCISFLFFFFLQAAIAFSVSQKLQKEFFRSFSLSLRHKRRFLFLSVIDCCRHLPSSSSSSSSSSYSSLKPFLVLFLPSSPPRILRLMSPKSFPPPP